MNWKEKGGLTLEDLLPQTVTGALHTIVSGMSMALDKTHFFMYADLKP